MNHLALASRHMAPTLLLVVMVIGTACTRLPATAAPRESAVGDLGDAVVPLDVDNDMADGSVAGPIAVNSVGAQSNFDGWKIPAPFCLAGPKHSGIMEDVYQHSADHWLAAGKYEVAALDYHILQPKLPDHMPMELTIAHFKLLDGWSPNAPATVLAMYQSCGPKACMVTLKVGDPLVLIVAQGKWDTSPTFDLPLSGVAAVPPPWLMFHQGPEGQWSNGELLIPTYDEFKAGVQKALAELAKTGDCSVEYLPAGYIKPVADVPDAGSSPDAGYKDVQGGWTLPDLQFPPDSGGKKTGGTPEDLESDASKSP